MVFSFGVFAPQSVDEVGDADEIWIYGPVKMNKSGMTGGIFLLKDLDQIQMLRSTQKVTPS